MTLIIQTSRIPGRTASATWRGQHWDNLVAPAKLLAGEYLIQETYELDPRFQAVSHHFGNRIIELAMRDSTDPVYLFAQSHSFGVNENTIGVPAELFDQLWAQVATGGFSLQLQRTWWVPGSHWVHSPMHHEKVDLQAYKGGLIATKKAESVPVPSWSLPLSSTTDGNALFAKLYPKVSTIYQPRALLAWFAWLMHRRDAVDKAHEGPVSCFSVPLRQRVREIPGSSESLQVELLDRMGNRVGGFVAALQGATLTLRTFEGDEFFIKEAGEHPVIFFSDGHTGFSWDGGDRLKTGAPNLFLEPGMLKHRIQS